MSARKKPEEFPTSNENAVLHPYHLQQLNLTKFISVSNRFLQGQLSMQTSLNKSQIIPSEKYRNHLLK